MNVKHNSANDWNQIMIEKLHIDEKIFQKSLQSTQIQLLNLFISVVWLIERFFEFDRKRIITTSAFYRIYFLFVEYVNFAMAISHRVCIVSQFSRVVLRVWVLIAVNLPLFILSKLVLKIVIWLKISQAYIAADELSRYLVLW